MKKTWKTYIGFCFFIYSFIPYIISALLPVFGFSLAKLTTLVTVLIISAEISFVLSVLILGKPFIKFLKTKIKNIFFGKFVEFFYKKTGRFRHYFGVFILFFGTVPYLISLILLSLGYTEKAHIKFIITMLVINDLLFIFSFYILGADFWERFKQLFKWQNVLNENKADYNS